MNDSTASSLLDSRALLEEAVALRQRRSALAATLRAAGEAAMQTLLPNGAILDLRREAWVERTMPNYLWQVQTVRGNDRRTLVFQIVGQPSVDIDMNHLGLSTWSCDALPISEKTGKLMSGRTSQSREDVVRLSGRLAYHLGLDDQSGPSELDLLMALFDGQAPPLSEISAAPAAPLNRPFSSPKISR